jgi:hypothetical protein
MDLKHSQSLILGSLLREREVWPPYAAERHPWRDTLLNVGLPAAVIAALGSFLLGMVFRSYYLFGAAGIGTLLHGLLIAVAALFIWAGAAYYFAGLFQPAATAPPVGPSDGGADAEEDVEAVETTTEPAAEPAAAMASLAPRSFDQAFAAVTFGFLPGFVGMVLQALPFVGALIMVIAAIYALMTLYRALPVFLPIAEPDRLKHFIATFLAALVASLVLSALLGAILLGSAADQARDRVDAGVDALEAQIEAADASERSLPELLGVDAQIDSVQSATTDEFDPPGHGRLTAAQVARTVKLLQRTAKLREDSGSRLKELAERADDGSGEEPSLGDLFKGIRGLVDVGTAEPQVVKAAGANWAEHEWIKQQLINARLSPDSSDTAEHNYELYEAHAEVLEELL